MSQITDSVHSRLHQEIENVEQVRDELRLKAHLMKEEMRTRWHALEKRWETYRANPAHRMSTAGNELVKDMKLAYGELKNDLEKLGRRVL